MKKLLTKALLPLVSIGIALLALEAGLHLLAPTPLPKTGYHVNRWARPDAELGWRLRPGNWPVDLLQQPMTIADDGTRLTAHQPGGPLRILLVGGSYALGYGVQDQQTLASQLQKRMPQATVVNAAVPGYGTYQSYLAAAAYLQEHPHSKPDIALYGYCQHHMVRNTQDGAWLRALRSYSGEQIIHPHLQEKALGVWEEQKPGRVNLLGLADDSLLIRHLQGLWLKRRYPRLQGIKHRDATKVALQLFAAWGKKENVRFVVADMFCENCGWLAAFCKERGIEYLDVGPDVQWKQEGWFLTDGADTSGHPNARFYEVVAEELAGKLKIRRNN